VRYRYYYEFELTKQSEDAQELLSTVTKACVRRMFVTNVDDYFTEKMAKRVKKKINGDVSKVHVEMLPNFRLNLNYLRDGFSTKLTQTRDNTPLPSKHWLTPAVCVVTFCVSIRYGEDSVRSHITAQRFGLKNSLKAGNYEQVNPVPAETDDTAEDFLGGVSTVMSSSDSDTESQSSPDENGLDQGPAAGASKAGSSGDTIANAGQQALPVVGAAAAAKFDLADGAQGETVGREHASGASLQLQPSTGAPSPNEDDLVQGPAAGATKAGPSGDTIVNADQQARPVVETAAAAKFDAADVAQGETVDREHVSGASLQVQSSTGTPMATPTGEPGTKAVLDFVPVPTPAAEQAPKKRVVQIGDKTPPVKISKKGAKKRGLSSAPAGKKSKKARGGGRK
jgi:hypothetical protein